MSGLLLAACGGETTTDAAAADASTTVDSLPFAEDDATTTDDVIDAVTSDDVDSPTDEELFSDDEIPAPDVTPDEPLSESEAAALLATAPAAPDEPSSDDDGAAESDDDVTIGDSTDDATHVGTFGVTAEHLMRELTLAYGGQGELLGEPSRTNSGGTFSFALTAVTIGDADSNRVDVEFSYVNDADQPDMIVGHRAERITITPFQLDG